MCRQRLNRRALEISILGLALGILLWPANAPALEPVEVRVEGRAPVRSDLSRALRAAFEQALVEAVLEVARLMVAPELLEALSEEDLAALEKKAPGYVLTFRPQGDRTEPSEEEPEVTLAVLELAATVDADQVRGWLEEVGLLVSQGRRPSVAMLVTATGGAYAGDPGLLAGFEESLARALETRGYLLVDPALAPEPGDRAGALDFARLVGADIGLDVAVTAVERGVNDNLQGVNAEVRVNARRAADSIELASSRFSAPGYHPDPDEALLRALDSLRGQVADNLTQQLDQNWRELSRGREPLRVRLANLTSQAQVEAVQRRLLRSLGARSVALVEIAPATAELEVESRLSPGALRDRLVATEFDGFRLDPVPAGGDTIQLRIEPLDEPDDSVPAVRR